MNRLGKKIRFRLLKKGVLLFLMWTSGFVRAQEPMALTLDQSIAIALEKSVEIQTLRQTMIYAERNLWAAKARYRTNITSALYAPKYDEGFKLIEQVEGNPIAKQYGSYQLRGTLDITQPMPWIPLGGADLTFRSEGYRLNSWTPDNANPDVLIQSTKFFSSLSMIVNKPLFTINEVSLELKRAKLEYERRARVYKRSELDLIYGVTNSFFELYRRTQQVGIDRESVSRQEGIYTTTSNKFKAGLIAEVDAMQAEVELLQYRNSLKRSEGALAEQESQFKQDIGLAPETTVQAVAELALKPVAVDLAKAKELALRNRSELVEKQIGIEVQKISIRQIDAQVSIQGNLSGYYDLSGFSDPGFAYGTDMETLFNSSWEKLQKTPNRGFTFQLQVPLFDWGRNRAQVQAAKATLRQNELDLEDTKITVVREAENVVRSVRETFERVQMLAKSQEVSIKSMDISLKRFANGDITTTELARASDQMNNAKTSYLQAYISYQLALADLKRKTLYDFEKDQPLVEN